MKLVENINPLVTVVIPVGHLDGNPDRLRETLIGSNSNNCEFILVLDNVVNRNIEQIRDLVLELGKSNVTLAEGSFGSPGLARNLGISLAQGEWLWFCDADDFAEIDTVVESIYWDSPQTEFVVFNFKKFNELTKTEHPNTAPLDDAALAMNPGIWRVLFRKNHESETDFGNYRLGEDQLFMVERGIFSSPISYRNQIVYSYTFGGEGHLVDRRDAVMDLAQVFRKITYVASKSNWKTRNLVNLMAIKQMITLVRIGGLRVKLSVCKTILGLTLSSPQALLMLLLQIPLFAKRSLFL